MPRALQVHQDYIPQAKLAVQRTGFHSQRALAEDVGLALSTVRQFLTGKPVDYATFVVLCERLQLDCQEIMALPTAPPKPVANQSVTSRHQDWGEAVDVSVFWGRTAELSVLAQWLLKDCCRVVAVLGMGGIGKTALSVKLAAQIQDDFEYVIWRSLRNAPPVEELLSELLLLLSHQQETNLPATLANKVTRLLEYLRSHRCLLVLDNFEGILSGGECAGRYRAGYEGYGELIELVGEVRHQSCLVITSREKPTEVAFLEGETLPIRSLELIGLPQVEAQGILNLKGLSGTEDERRNLIECYSGNPLALKGGVNDLLVC